MIVQVRGRRVGDARFPADAWATSKAEKGIPVVRRGRKGKKSGGKRGKRGGPPPPPPNPPKTAGPDGHSTTDPPPGHAAGKPDRVTDTDPGDQEDTPQTHKPHFGSGGKPDHGHDP